MLSAETRAGVSWRMKGNHSLGGDEFNSQIMSILNYSHGTGAGQCDLVYAETRTIVSGGNGHFDLAGVLVDAFGNVIEAAELVAFFIRSRPTNTTTLTIGGGVGQLAGWIGSDGLLGPVRPGGGVIRTESDAAGICAVVAGTADILRISNSAGAPAIVDVVILARSVA